MSTSFGARGKGRQEREGRICDRRLSGGSAGPLALTQLPVSVNIFGVARPQERSEMLETAPGGEEPHGFHL